MSWSDRVGVAAALVVAWGVSCATIGCGRALHGGKPSGRGAGGDADGGAGSGGGASGANGGGAGAGGGGGSAACAGGETLAPKRLVRLTQAQVLRSIEALLGDQVAAATVQGDIVFPDGPERAFPPLASLREGALITDITWQEDDAMAQRAAGAVLDGFAAVTPCGDAPSDDCGRGFVLDFAARAYRRPLSADESQSLATVYDETRALLGNVKEAVQFGVYAVLEAPEFLYRSELGSDGQSAGTLTPHELASALSYFLTDGPPDRALLDAAAGGLLASDADLAAQVNRLLATDAARDNLESAMMSYLSLANLDTVVFDTTAISGIDDFVSEAGRRSIKGETTRFLHQTMWGGSLADLLTSNRSWVDATLARLYGVSFPPPGAALDADGFAAVNLPNGRAGLLTQASFLMSHARPSWTSAVARGLLVRTLAVCANPVPAEPLLPDIRPPSNGATAKQVAEARLANAACRPCHTEIDPYGIPLESFDVIGRYRTVDDQGRPIDTSTTLPPVSGGAAVADAPAMLRELAKGDRFAACMTQMFLIWAMADPSSDFARPDSCINRGVIQSLAGAGAPSPPQAHLSDVLRGVATSPAFRTRRTGGTP